MSSGSTLGPVKKKGVQRVTTLKLNEERPHVLLHTIRKIFNVFRIQACPMQFVFIFDQL